MIQLFLCLIKNYENKTYGKIEVQLREFLTSVEVGVTGHLHATAALPAARAPGIYSYFIRDWGAYR
jgi:hypothetical protein